MDKKEYLTFRGRHIGKRKPYEQLKKHRNTRKIETRERIEQRCNK